VKIETENRAKIETENGEQKIDVLIVLTSTWGNGFGDGKKKA
jgi:hypothetical protein